MFTSRFNKSIFISLVIGILLFPVLGFAGNSASSTTGVNGYDLVSFHTGKKPLVGNGNHLAAYNGVTYLFVSEANKSKFEGNPQKYVPAYGVSVGKKFVGDSDVWKIVDGKLHLNLDTKIQGIWLKNIPKNNKKAGRNWKKIRDKDPSDL